jgi:hypothetical protein
MMKPRGLGLSRGAPMPRDPMEDMGGEMEAMGLEYGGEESYDPPPRRPLPADRGGPDFDPTDPVQKPRGYDRYSQEAQRDAERVQDETRNGDGGRAMMEWRRRWLQRAKEAGLDERQASQALDDIEDSL